MIDTQSEKMLAEIVRKAPQELVKEEQEFLRARRSYLTRDQAEKFADILEDEAAEKPLKKMTAEELAAKAQELGIAVDGLAKKDLIEAIEEKLAA